MSRKGEYEHPRNLDGSLRGQAKRLDEEDELENALAWSDTAVKAKTIEIVLDDPMVFLTWYNPLWDEFYYKDRDTYTQLVEIAFRLVEQDADASTFLDRYNSAKEQWLASKKIEQIADFLERYKAKIEEIRNEKD